MPPTEGRNLKGWIQELVDSTAPEQCNALLEVLLVERNETEFLRRVQRVRALSAHVLSYGVDDEEWEMAVREQDHIDSAPAVRRHLDEISPALQGRAGTRALVDVLTVTHFRMRRRLAVLSDANAVEGSLAIQEAHNRQPTLLPEIPPKQQERRRAA